MVFVKIWQLREMGASVVLDDKKMGGVGDDETGGLRNDYVDCLTDDQSIQSHRSISLKLLAANAGMLHQRAIICAGDAVGDLTLTVDALPRSGEDVQAQSMGWSIGGCGMNMLRVAVSLGCIVQPAMVVGTGVWGERIDAALGRWNLSSPVRNRTCDNGWCLALIEPDGQRSFISVWGAEGAFPIEPPSVLVEKNALVYTTGYSLGLKSNGGLHRWIDSLDEQAVRFIDCGPMLSIDTWQVMDPLVTKGSILTFNDDEYRIFVQLIDSTVQDFADARRVNIIHRRGNLPTRIVMPLSPTIEVPAAHRVNVVDTTGAGDAHAGAFLSAYACGYSFADSVYIANMVAAWVCQHHGVELAPALDDLQCFIDAQKHDDMGMGRI